MLDNFEFTATITTREEEKYDLVRRGWHKFGPIPTAYLLSRGRAGQAI